MNPEEEGLIPPKPSVKAPANFTSPDELYKELEDVSESIIHRMICH